MVSRARKRKTYRLALIAFLAILAIISITMFMASIKADVCDKIQDKDKQIFCLALTSKDPSLCGTFEYNTSNFYKNYCLESIALKTENESICEQISEEGYVDDRDTCFFQVALKKGDESICSMTGDFEPECFSHIAIKRNDSHLCVDVVNSSLPELCHAITESNPSYCEIIEIPHFYCEINTSYCEKFREGEISLCYLDYLKRGNKTDISICSRIPDPKIRSSCYEYIAINTRNISLCEYLNDDTELVYRKINCFVSILKDISYCKDCEDPSYCYGRLAAIIQNDSLCHLAKNPDDCLRSIASSKCDAVLCSIIKEQETRDSCYVDMARECPKT